MSRETPSTTTLSGRTSAGRRRVGSAENFLQLRKSNFEATFAYDLERKRAREKGAEPTYVGKPEMWTVLDETVPDPVRLQKQIEIQDPKIRNQLFEQIDGIILEKDVLHREWKEEVPTPVVSRYEFPEEWTAPEPEDDFAKKWK